ncbi:porin [Cupriavidus sp. 2TAF22]|uniref:porin n=1 Tax=unclassified Cupriavidus TaxID=2640874 RepID=UPI003F92612A
MKKTMVASAALILASGAWAQSAVTLYGVADAGLEFVNRQPGNGDKVYRMQSGGGLTGSRWGLRGVEDLGGGLKGIFVLESGFSIDDGKTDGRLFGRQSYVGLETPGGTVTLGRQQTPMYDFALRYDPMATASSYSIYAMDNDFGSRADNAIKYRGSFGGLTASGLYSFGHDGVSGTNGEVPGQWKVGREYAFGLNYATGAFAVGAVFDQKNGDTIASRNRHDQRASIAGSYAFGPAKVFGGYRWQHLGFTPATGSGIAHLGWAGISYQLTAATSFSGALYYQDYRGTSADPWLFSLGANYAVSKRTELYMNMAYALNKTDNARGFMSQTSVNGDGQVLPGENQFGASVGMRHRF